MDAGSSINPKPRSWFCFTIASEKNSLLPAYIYCNIGRVNVKPDAFPDK